MSNEKMNCRIFLADDDADDRKYFMEALKEIDPSAECMMATDGAGAVEMLNDPALVLPNYIFLDLRMPKLNGRQCLSLIKENERLKDIPVIIYTTSKEVQDSEELQNMGAVRFISKPANTEEIYYVISQVLEEYSNNKFIN